MYRKKYFLDIIRLDLLFPSLLILLFTNSCYRPPTIKKVTKSPVYSFQPQSIRKEIEPGFKVEISKCDPDELNRDTYLAARRISSENEMETFVSFESNDQKNNKGSKSSNANAFKNIDWLNEKNIIDTRLVRELKLSYSPGYPSYNDIGSISSPKTIPEINYPSIDNPYKLNRFTMFRILMINESTELKKIQLSNLIISSGLEQLYPLSIKYFDTIFSPTTNEYQNILRFNLPNELQIPAGKSVLKFIAFPIINELNEDLSLTINKSNQTNSFDFKRETIFIGGTYNFRFYSINPKTFFTNPEITVIIELENKFYVLKNSKQMFFYEKDLGKPINIFCFTHIGHEFEFGKIENLVLSEFKGNNINIKLKNYKN
jgi:hypothetical protein